MKITDVECLVLDRQFPFVRIYTDEGIVGIGECFRRLPRVIKAITDGSLKPALVGKDPLDTELRWRICTTPVPLPIWAERSIAPWPDWTSPCGTSKARLWECPFTSCWAANCETQ